ncbi:helix-turn-helix domain-containing protein [Henriciella marina]|uniref:helix-turn-helix domain-containing protein n=1 Tax=Henriciella marina TaxID=453851 RepID=UPI000377A8F2|nr:helix-turn-helix transcriptional regulator [Henriciella marina]
MKRLRNLKGWSQEHADRSSLNRTYISGVEHGVKSPTVIVIDQLAIALEALPAEFFKRDPD